MLNKFTIIGLIIGSIISILGAASMIDSLSNPNEIQEDSATFGVGDLDKINFNAPENSYQSFTVTGDSFDIKITTPDLSNNVDASFKDKASFSWTSTTSGQTIITIQNTGDSEFTTRAVADKIGLKGESINGNDLENLSEEKWDKVDTNKVKTQWLKEIQEVEDNLEQYIGGS